MEKINIQAYKDMEHSALVFDNSPTLTFLKFELYLKICYTQNVNRKD